MALVGWSAGRSVRRILILVQGIFKCDRWEQCHPVYFSFAVFFHSTPAAALLLLSFMSEPNAGGARYVTNEGLRIITA